MNYNPLQDGITHLNIYSKAETELGRLFSNFAYCPIETEDGHFDSIEGYWGWLSISEENPERENFRTLSGIAAKKLKTSLYNAGDPGRTEPDFERKIEAAVHLKFQTEKVRKMMEKYRNLLSLPICHYYYYGEKNNPKIVDVTEKYPELIHSIRKEVSDFVKESKGIFGITKGIICQQVNCQQVMGAGIAKVIADKYPVVFEEYHAVFEMYDKKDLFGNIQIIEVEDGLFIANLFTQFNYGNASKTGQVYTNAELLVKAVEAVCKDTGDLPVYIPHQKAAGGEPERGIGCGYGGESWEKLGPMFRDLKMQNLHLFDPKTGEVHEFEFEPKIIRRSPFERHSMGAVMSAKKDSVIRYAGVGSRETPNEVLELFERLAGFLGDRGCVLRSGGAEGADTAFENGCGNHKKEIFLPWKMEGREAAFTGSTPEAEEIVKKYHSAWDSYTWTSKKLLGRDAFQVLGLDLKTPVDFVICYTEGGNLKGGTSTAIKLAMDNGIPVLNAGNYFDEVGHFNETLFKADFNALYKRTKEEKKNAVVPKKDPEEPEEERSGR